MKHLTLLLLAAVFATCSASVSRAQQTSPLIPTGTLTAFPTFVQTGTNPMLTWNVTLPQSITDVVTITPPGTLTPKKSMTMNVRVLGASVKRVWLNSWGQVTSWEWVPTEAQMRVGSGSWSRIFYNTHNNVNPNTIVRTQTVSTNVALNFGGRYYVDGSWSTLYTTQNSSTNVVALKNGDTPPTTTPLYQQPTIQSFIIPYLDSNGNMKLGPRDVIYLMELTHTDQNHSGFDLQDLCLLVTFVD